MFQTVTGRDKPPMHSPSTDEVKFHSGASGGTPSAETGKPERRPQATTPVRRRRHRAGSNRRRRVPAGSGPPRVRTAARSPSGRTIRLAPSPRRETGSARHVDSYTKGRPALCVIVDSPGDGTASVMRRVSARPFLYWVESAPSEEPAKVAAQLHAIFHEHVLAENDRHRQHEQIDGNGQKGFYQRQATTKL